MPHMLQLPEDLQTTGVGIHVAFFLLRCSITAKPVYLLAQLDDITLEVMRSLLGKPLLSINQTAVLHRPVRVGGLGLPSFRADRDLLHAHHLLLLAHAWTRSPTGQCRPHRLLIRAAMRQCKDTMDLDIPRILDQPSDDPCSHVCRGALRKLRAYQHRLNAFSLLDQRRHVAMTSWIVAPQGTFVADKTFTATMRTHLHLPLLHVAHPCRYAPSTTNVPCNALLDEWGRHNQHCCRQAVQARHHVLRNLLAELAQTAGWHGVIEQEIQVQAGQKRADVLLTRPDGTRRALDIAVVHQQADSAASAALKARGRKERQYLGDVATGRMPGGEEFVAVVHVAGGFLDDLALQLAEKMCADMATKLTHVQRLTVPVAKHTARHRVYGGLMRMLATHEVRVLEARGELL